MFTQVQQNMQTLGHIVIVASLLALWIESITALDTKDTALNSRPNILLMVADDLGCRICARLFSVVSIVTYNCMEYVDGQVGRCVYESSFGWKQMQHLYSVFGCARSEGCPADAALHRTLVLAFALSSPHWPSSSAPRSKLRKFGA